MKRAKRRVFRHPVWIHFISSRITADEFDKTLAELRARGEPVDIVGEIGWIEGVIFIESLK